MTDWEARAATLRAAGAGAPELRAAYEAHLAAWLARFEAQKAALHLEARSAGPEHRAARFRTLAFDAKRAEQVRRELAGELTAEEALAEREREVRERAARAAAHQARVVAQGARALEAKLSRRAAHKARVAAAREAKIDKLYRAYLERERLKHEAPGKPTAPKQGKARGRQPAPPRPGPGAARGGGSPLRPLPYICPRCKSGFRDEAAWIKHIQGHHRDVRVHGVRVAAPPARRAPAGRPAATAKKEKPMYVTVLRQRRSTVVDAHGDPAVRVNHCWSCREPLNSEVHDVCSRCRGMTCSEGHCFCGVKGIFWGSRR